LEENEEEIVWAALSKNPNAIHLLEENEEEIDWQALSRNPNATHLLEKNPEKIDWWSLSENPNAIHLMEKNPDKIVHDYQEQYKYLMEKTTGKTYMFGFNCNPSIFKKTVNYKYLKERMNIIREELMMKCMHPKRLERWLEMGGEIDDF
jgi:predicted esterase YcpF (UPF0227 family)